VARAEAASPDDVELLDVVDDDLTVSASTWGDHELVLVADDGTFADRDRQITVWVRMLGVACASDVRVRATDPTGATLTRTPFDGCPANPGLLTATITVPFAGAGDWQLEFSYPPGKSGEGYSVRAIRLDAVPRSNDDLSGPSAPGLDASHDAVALANRFEAELNTVGSSVTAGAAIEPTGSQTVGEGYVYDYRSVTEAGGSERDKFAESLGSVNADSDAVDVSVVRNDATIELVLLERCSSAISRPAPRC